MLNWLRKMICPDESYAEGHLATGKTLLPPDPSTQARITVVYNVQEGTDLQHLVCDADVTTEFFNDPSDVIKNAMNSAAEILVDKGSIVLLYKSILNNMLYVPNELREKPN